MFVYPPQYIGNRLKHRPILSKDSFVMRFRSCIPTAFMSQSATTNMVDSTQGSGQQPVLHLTNDMNKNLVKGLPMLKYDKDHLCPSCQLGKSKKASHPLKAENTNTEVLHTLHMDLLSGPMRTEKEQRKEIMERVCEQNTHGWFESVGILMKRAYLGLHNRTALSKDGTELLWKLLVLCSSLRKLHCSNGALEAVATKRGYTP
ncbi:hypothetical protein Tco_0577504 [Tanacetum coccineum]